MAPAVNLTEVRDFLTERRASLVAELHAERQHWNVGREPADYAESAAGSCEQDMNMFVTDMHSRELAAIEKTLEKIEENIYGLCAKCGEPISAARLKALPTATNCIACQQSSERMPMRKTPTSIWGGSIIPYELAFES